ncbi:hypothetical protein MPNT_230010 [Candidatus Methylacidithermus pantelleriae]|uniref:Uncharacterized protein n=1 Tax=Candidatus Methylacidithermus pantelleriae TaxID=2744239 RepID=A0A8J2BPY0_9BACT|nr:hypothetical protein MPNT_230010 [Candidatus Methylacidithermus pantelleriae]
MEEAPSRGLVWVFGVNSANAAGVAGICSLRFRRKSKSSFIQRKTGKFPFTSLASPPGRVRNALNPERVSPLIAKTLGIGRPPRLRWMGW